MTKFHSNLVEYVRSSLWLIPLVGFLVALGAAAVTLWIDLTWGRKVLTHLVTRDPETARSILGVVAGAILTLTALVFSVTMVVLQLASSQYSPRGIRAFLRERQTKVTMATFLGTFGYSLVILRSVHSVDGGFVPSISVLVTYVLVIASLLMFIAFLDHIARSIQVSHIIDRIASESEEILDRLPVPIPTSSAHVPLPEVTYSIIWPRRAGVLGLVDETSLLEQATERDCILRVIPAVGDFICSKSAVIDVLGTPRRRFDERALLGAITVGLDRTPQQDLAFGVRNLVDIAVRALSPGTNDPTTAVQAIDRIHDLLRRLVQRPFGDNRVFNERGELRLLVPRLRWPQLLEIATTEIRLSSGGMVQVTRRLFAMLNDLHSIAPPSRRDVIERQLQLLRTTTNRGVEQPEDRQLACCADPQGLGTRVSASSGH